jgi:hypothetical protein
VIRLFEGEPQVSSVHTSHYRYYRFTLTGYNDDVTFTLTREFGDPDLYVNLGDNNFPTVFNNQWSSTSSASDLVRINNPAPGNTCQRSSLIDDLIDRPIH